MDKATEYYTLQKYYGTDWINKLLGDYKSYLYLRNEHTFADISNEIKRLND